MLLYIYTSAYTMFETMCDSIFGTNDTEAELWINQDETQKCPIIKNVIQYLLEMVMSG